MRCVPGREYTMNVRIIQQNVRNIQPHVPSLPLKTLRTTVPKSIINLVPKLIIGLLPRKHAQTQQSCHVPARISGGGVPRSVLSGGEAHAGMEGICGPIQRVHVVAWCIHLVAYLVSLVV